MFLDNPEVLRRMADYIERYKNVKGVDQTARETSVSAGVDLWSVSTR